MGRREVGKRGEGEDINHDRNAGKLIVRGVEQL